MAPDERLQARVDALLKTDAEARPLTEADLPLPFSPFDRGHAERAGWIVRRMSEAADRDGLDAAIATAEDAAETEAAGLVKHAVTVFVTHHPEARGLLVLPSVEAVETRAVPKGEVPPPSARDRSPP